MCHFKLNPEIILLTADSLYMKTWIPLTNIVALGRGGDFSSKTNLIFVTIAFISNVWRTIQCSFVLYSNIDGTYLMNIFFSKRKVPIPDGVYSAATNPMDKWKECSRRSIQLVWMYINHCLNRWQCLSNGSPSFWHSYRCPSTLGG